MINEFAIFAGTAKRLSGTETKITHVVGKVSDLACLIVDDMITTGRYRSRSYHGPPKGGRAARDHRRGHARAICRRRA